MLFRNTLSYLLLGASLLLSVNSLPTPGTEHAQEEDTEFKWEPDTADRLNEWIKKAVIKNSQNQKWIQLPANDCPGAGQNRLRFRNEGSPEIQKYVLKERPGTTGMGNYNFGIYDVSPPFELPGGRKVEDQGAYIVKTVDLSEVTASCEPFALKQFNIWHRTGVIRQKIGNDLIDVGAILLQTVPGGPLQSDPLWNTASAEQKAVLFPKIRAEVYKQVYELAFRKRTNGKHLLWIDLHENNSPVLLDMKNGQLEIVELNLIDFGYPGIATWKYRPSNEEFDRWFSRQFELWWMWRYWEFGVPDGTAPEDVPILKEFIQSIKDHKGVDKKGKKAETEAVSQLQGNDLKGPWKTVTRKKGRKGKR